MQRLTLAATITIVLAAGILFFRSRDEAAQGPVKPHAGRTQVGIGSGDSPPEGALRSGKRLPAPETIDRFQKQAHRIAAMPQDSARENAVRELAQAWGKAAPTAAERWARTLEDPAERERALTHLCLEVEARDPREALRIAGSHRLHPGMVDAIAARWAAADFDGASSWAADLPEGEARDRVWMQLVRTRAGNAPAEAATMLSESPLSGKARDEAAMSVLHQWLLTDPEAARQWVELFPDGPLKERATVEVQSMSAHR